MGAGIFLRMKKNYGNEWFVESLEFIEPLVESCRSSISVNTTPEIGLSTVVVACVLATPVTPLWPKLEFCIEIVLSSKVG